MFIRVNPRFSLGILDKLRRKSREMLKSSPQITQIAQIMGQEDRESGNRGFERSLESLNPGVLDSWLLRLEAERASDSGRVERAAVSGVDYSGVVAEHFADALDRLLFAPGPEGDSGFPGRHRAEHQVSNNCLTAVQHHRDRARGVAGCRNDPAADAERREVEFAIENDVRLQRGNLRPAFGRSQQFQQRAAESATRERQAAARAQGVRVKPVDSDFRAR